ncbi:MAG: hypothetical protein A2Y33_09630 [Spirochaetes bacterium GWF1_51_8]|nr:MAG: hypothetical protein A2Y33_09630 [Spirochaetes bacterium GWF1_51_8]
MKKRLFLIMLFSVLYFSPGSAIYSEDPKGLIKEGSVAETKGAKPDDPGLKPYPEDIVYYGISDTGGLKNLVLIQPLDKEMPSSVFQTLKDKKKYSYLIDEIKNNKTIQQTFDCFAYSAQISKKPNKKVFLALCEEKSPYMGVPFVQHFKGKYSFKLDGKKGQGSIYFQPVNEEYGDKEAVKTGAFQTGFIHETAHIILANLVPDYPERAVQSEGVSSVTDPNVAFDEGFAELFEIFFMTRMPQYKSGKFLENIPFWHQIEFNYFRGYGVENNLFVWDEWGSKTLQKLEKDGVKLLLKGKLIPMKKLRSMDDMLACEGVVVRILLDTVKAIAEKDANKKIDLQTFGDWNGVLKPAFFKLMDVIAENEVTSIQELWYAVSDSPDMKKYKFDIWRVFLEDSYYAFGSTDYALMYQKYANKKITQKEYKAWKDKVFKDSLTGTID